MGFALEVLGADKSEVVKKANQALRWVGLERKAGCLPSQLSAGEQQRLAIARAVVNDPVLLLADEPTGNLSPGAAEEIMRLFEKINLRGTTVVLATHNEALPSMWPKEKITLEQGRIVDGAISPSRGGKTRLRAIFRAIPGRGESRKRKSIPGSGI